MFVPTNDYICMHKEHCYWGLKVGWITCMKWITFLMDQVGLIHKLNYLDVAWILIDHIFFKKWYYQLVEWTLHMVNVLNHCWYETSLLPQAILKHMVSRDWLSKTLCMGPVLYLKKSMALYRIFLCHFALLLKRKLQHVDHKWVTSRLLCGSMGHCWTITEHSYCSLSLSLIY